ncbi:MAG: 30S ribosomal protein S2 [Candidatus Lokiarchaeota archaeon]|nr:30S ribosomal protein S2 [Candidatus Lokiarchaeota archaeon]
MSEEDLLIPRDDYLAAGIHIGTQIKSADMEPFIYRITRSGLYVIDIRKTDYRLHVASKFISRFDPSKVAVISSRRYGHKPVSKFSEILKTKSIVGRFIPGMLTNPTAKNYTHAELVVLSDPRADRHALAEAKISRIPVISLCDTDNSTSNVDLIIPANNRGRKSLALIFWILTRQVLLEKGLLRDIDEFNYELEDFYTKGRILFQPNRMLDEKERRF